MHDYIVYVWLTSTVVTILSAYAKLGNVTAGGENITVNHK